MKSLKFLKNYSTEEVMERQKAQEPVCIITVNSWQKWFVTFCVCLYKWDFLMIGRWMCVSVQAFEEALYMPFLTGQGLFLAASLLAWRDWKVTGAFDWLPVCLSVEAGTTQSNNTSPMSLPHTHTHTLMCMNAGKIRS